jgi:hypothetical protein
MWLFYVIAAVFLLIGGIAWLRDRRIVAWEWAASGAAGFAVAGIFQVVANAGMTHDTEVWSGRITTGAHRSAWMESYEEAVYRQERRTRTVPVYNDKGRQVGTRPEVSYKKVFDHWAPRTRHHADRWTADDSLGQHWEISREQFDLLVSRFGERHAVAGDRSTSERNSRMVSGDPNDYVAVNRTGWIQPTTAVKSWENRVKAAPSQFSFPLIPEPEQQPLHPYPDPPDPFTSTRVLGQTAIPILEWDQLNARLGPVKHVNLIVIGFGSQPISAADNQRAVWLGGKKNDLVITAGGAPEKPTWARVFGWSESDACKRTIETLVLTHGLTPALIAPLEAEVMATYTIKDWTRLDYLAVEPPWWSYLVLIGVMIAVHGLLWIGFTMNGQDKT